MSKPRGHTNYQSQWESEFPWLKPINNKPFLAFCQLCSTEINVDSMGRQAIKSHAAGKKHKLRLTETNKTPPVSSFFASSTIAKPSASTEPLPTEPLSTNPETSTNPGSTTSTPTTPHQCQQQGSIFQDTSKTKLSSRGIMEKFIFQDRCTFAEIVWCLHTIKHHLSLRAAAESCSLFKTMFVDSEVAAKLQLQKSKIAYAVTHGLGPFFQTELTKKIKNCTNVVVGFDESLNKISQSCQMDISVRFWNDATDRVQSRYLTSVFLHKTTAKDLLDGLKSGMAERIELKKLLQLSMDGPNVNFKLLSLLKEQMNDEELPQLLDLGSCGLHTVHGAFKTGIKKTGWNIISFLRAIYNHFKNVPARRGEFMRVSQNELMPQKFCEVRWLENVAVAERAALLLPYLKKYFDETKEKKSNENKTNTLRTIETCLQNKLLPAQLSFFQSLAEEITPFLQEFQTDGPMAPFLYGDLTTLLTNILKRIVKPDLIKEELPVTKIDLNKSENLIFAKDLDLGFATRHAIRNTETCTGKEIVTFRNECLQCLKWFALKLLERSPLKYKLTKSLTCINPEYLKLNHFNLDKEIKNCLDLLLEAKQITAREAEHVSREFKLVCFRLDVKEAFKIYNRKETRLDTFWMQVVKEDPQSINLKRFLQKLLILSHGNASVERGFSINKEVLVVNQQEKSLIAQRHIIDAINDVGGVDQVSVTKSMMHFYRNAHSRYKESLEEEKKRNASKRKLKEEAKENKKKIQELQEKKRKLLQNVEQEAQSLQSEIEDLKMKK